MAISLNPNIASLIAKRNLDKATDSASVSMERLSSGMRINHAKDDPAALALATSLSASSKIYTQAIRNVNDGVSLLNSADAALEALAQIVERQQELATQASNGSYTSTQRSALDTEFQALTTEYSRILGSASFNGQQIFQTSATSVTLQAGPSTLDTIAVGFSSSTTLAEGTGAGSSTSTANGSFAAYTRQATSFRPGGLTSADLNGDGKLDLAVAEDNTNTIRVMIGNGNGTFKTEVSYAVVSARDRVFTSDINGDGRLDIVAGSNAGNDPINVLLNQGNGTFGTNTSYFTGFAGATVNQTMADFNNDGSMDFAVPDFTGALAVVYIGNANGTFKAGLSIATGLTPNSIGAADFNGDGNKDLLVGSNGDDTVLMFLGNGNGTFKSVTTLFVAGTALNPVELATADFNGDSKQDILFSSGAGTQTFTIALGNGNGTFKARVSTAMTSDTNQYQISDFNADGIVDFAASQSNSSVLIFRGVGDGTFSGPTTLTNIDIPETVTIGDFNGDSVNDIIATNYTDQSITFFAGNATTSSTPGGALSISTQSNALSALTSLSTISSALEVERGNVGASLSRLDITLSMISSQVGNYDAAYARIMDADQATELANLVKNQIIQQAATAILAQANQQASTVTTLLNFKIRA